MQTTTHFTESGPSIEVDAAPPSPIREATNDIAPFLAGLAPLSIALGAAMASTGMNPIVGLAGAALILAGQSQLAAIEMIAAGSGVGSIVLAVALINARFALYSASLVDWFRDEPKWRRFALAASLVDIQYVLCGPAYEQQSDARWRRRYYLTLSGLAIAMFLGGQAIGVVVGEFVPAGLGLDLAALLGFVGVLADKNNRAADTVAAVLAAVIVVVGAALPGGMGLPLAIVVGALVAKKLDGAS